MRRAVTRLFTLAALLAALPLLAQGFQGPFGSPPPHPSALILLDDKGNEVLRLTPDQATTGPKSLPAGEYVLKVEAPGVYRVALGQPTQLEVGRQVGLPPAAKLGGQAPPVVIDFDPAPGDQGQRQTQVPGPGAQVSLQLAGLGLPPIHGWSAVLEFDPSQLRLVDDSFAPSGFIPNFVPLVDAKGARVEVGGANLYKNVAKGDGDLGSLGFEVLAGFKGETAVKLVQVTLRRRDGGDTIQIGMPGLVVGAPAGFPPGPPGPGPQMPGPQGPGPGMPGSQMPGGQPPAGAGPQAVEQLLQTKACPGCDLTGAQIMSPAGAPIDLSGADLTGAILKDANLFLVDLSKAKLAGAVLVNANLMRANLASADLSNADLTGARLQNAKLVDANLTGAKGLDRAVLRGTDLTNATWVDGARCGPGSIDRCNR